MRVYTVVGSMELLRMLTYFATSLCHTETVGLFGRFEELGHKENQRKQLSSV